MATVTVEEARKRFDELIAELPTAGSITITDGEKIVATLLAGPTMSRGPGPHSVLDIKPLSLGGMLKPYPHPDDDILGEMLDGKFENWRPK